MAHNSRIRGHLSPPDSVSDDGQYIQPDSSAHLVAAPYDTPPMTVAQTYSYADPGQYGLQEDQAYYGDEVYPESVYRTPPQPIRNGGMQTRSGRSIGTPMTTGSPSSRVSASPRSKRNKKGKDKNLEARITEPLSTMTRDYEVPVEDMEAWVSRSNEDRWKEVKGRPKNNIPRPMNSFMLYRRAYKERIKKWGQQGDNNQMISSVAGISWNMEPAPIKEYYTRVANLEKENHAKAFPDYKFTPNKTAQKRARDDDEDSDPEWEGESLYGSKRSRRRDDRDVTRSRSATPGQTSWAGSPQYHGSPYPSNDANMLAPPHEYWAHADAYHATYSAYPRMQMAYAQPMHPLSYGPTSVPMSEQRYMSPPIGLPPGMDGMAEDQMLRAEYGIDPGLEDHYQQSNSYHYGSYVDGQASGMLETDAEYAAQTQDAIHPGMQTLAPAESSWDATENVGSAFDTELNRWPGGN